MTSLNFKNIDYDVILVTISNYVIKIISQKLSIFKPSPPSLSKFPVCAPAFYSSSDTYFSIEPDLNGAEPFTSFGTFRFSQ